MAEIVLTAVINKAMDLAGNLLFQQGEPLFCLKDEVEWLQRVMRHIRSYIEVAKARAIEGNPQVQTLLKDIQELGEDVETILDEFLPEMEESQKSKGPIGCATCVPFRPSFAKEFSREIEKIRNRVDDVDRVRKAFNIEDTISNNNNPGIVPLDRRKLFLGVDEAEVIGLDDDFNILKAKLLDQGLQYGAVSIVGMPGLGKTTLAKKLYRQVCSKFECSALIYVSQQPRLGEILLDIAKQAGLSKEEMKDDLVANLTSLLKQKRYVILLDDIWNVDIWDDLKLTIPEGDSKFGSRIIITSRKSDVGRYIGEESSLHKLEPLDPEKSFELFTKRISSSDKAYWADAPPNLKNIGREIVGRCGGVPLAIVLIAGVLRAREKTEHAWNRVQETMSQNIQEQCATVLTLSYNDLSIALRPCFLYFGLFPEDHEIRAFDLVNMWVAEKFVVASHDDRGQVEDIGEDFLNDLVSRNLIQVSKRTFQGRIARCRIHDLLHDLCVTLAKESNFFLTNDNASGVVARQRRVASYSGGADEFFSSSPNPKKLRAFLSFGEEKSLKTHLNLKLLRVLFVHVPEKNGVVRIPKGIGSLSSLVYLKLKGEGFWGHIPRNIVKLKHLITLDILETHITIDFDVLMKMKQLKHVRVYDMDDPFMTCTFLSSPNATSLPNLQTLVCRDSSNMRARWIQQCTNLRRLCLHAAGWNNGIVDLFSTDVALLPKLEVLQLIIFGWNMAAEINLSSYDNLVKLHLAVMLKVGSLPSNLIKLTLDEIKLDRNNITTIKRLPKLKTLKLRGCSHKAGENQIDLSGAGSFSQLEELHITAWDRLGEFEEIIMDDLGTPKLNNLRVSERYRGKLRISERLARLAIYR